MHLVSQENRTVFEKWLIGTFISLHLVRFILQFTSFSLLSHLSHHSHPVIKMSSPDIQSSNVDGCSLPEPSVPEPDVYVSTAKPRSPLTPEEEENMKKPKVLIVGAGLGGLTLAILLHKAKIPFELFERAHAVKHLGKNRMFTKKFKGPSRCAHFTNFRIGLFPLHMYRLCHVFGTSRYDFCVWVCGHEHHKRCFFYSEELVGLIFIFCPKNV